MVQHLTNVPTSETLIQSLADMGAVAPAASSDTPTSFEFDTLKLPSSLTALAVPLAATVARVEAVTRAEVEQDAWLHDTLVNFAVIAQTFIDASRALHVVPAPAGGAAACSREAPEAAADAVAAGLVSGGTCAADDAAGTAADDAAPVKVADASGSVSVVLCQARQTCTDSNGSAYASSAAGSSDGSVAAGSVSVNHTGINGVDDSNSMAGDGCASDREGPLQVDAAGDCEGEKSGRVTIAGEPVGAGHSLLPHVSGCLKLKNQ